MELIHHEIAVANAAQKRRVGLFVDRLTLAKRRWRGVAQDGCEFGFDMEHPLPDGSAFFESETAVYYIAQQPEDLCEIPLGDPALAARVGWSIGNLHFPVAIADGVALAPDDAAIRQLLDREHIHYAVVKKVFHPFKIAAGHHHHEH